MGLNKTDKDFRYPKVAHIDFKLLEMDRVLIAFLQRLYHHGYPSRLTRPFDLTVSAFRNEFIEHPERFEGFDRFPAITERWIETHLMDIVNRGKPDQEAIAAPRPLHGFMYLFRNPKHARDYRAAEQVYETLAGARNGTGDKALDQLRSFFFQGYDLSTDQAIRAETLDVETQALLHLKTMVTIDDAPDYREQRNSYPPLCVGSADLMAEDMQRLLFYRAFMPRSVMVDYLKVLISFHLALYYLRLFKLLPTLVRRAAGDPVCAACPVQPQSFDNPHGDCPYRIGLLLDIEGQTGTAMARLAERSADTHYRRISDFVKANFIAKKLDEFAMYLVQRNRLPVPPSGGFPIGQVLELLQPRFQQEREVFFDQRVQRIVEDSTAAANSELEPEIKAILDLKLSNFDTYVEILVAQRGPFHRKYAVQCLDSLLLKNDPGALLTQLRNRRDSPRRFILDSRLLEALLQIAVLRPGGALGYHTAELRVDELLLFLRERYGLFIDRLPPGDGFGLPSIDDRQALRTNLEAFSRRLREVGYFQDLSDAYITQTLAPRYRIDRNGATVAAKQGSRP